MGTRRQEKLKAAHFPDIVFSEVVRRFDGLLPALHRHETVHGREDKGELVGDVGRRNPPYPALVRPESQRGFQVQVIAFKDAGELKVDQRRCLEAEELVGLLPCRVLEGTHAPALGRVGACVDVDGSEVEVIGIRLPNQGLRIRAVLACASLPPALIVLKKC